MQLLKGIFFVFLIIGTKVLFAQKMPVGYFSYISDNHSSLIKLSAGNDFQYYSRIGCFNEMKFEGKLEKQDSVFGYKAIVTDTLLVKKLKALQFELVIKPVDSVIIVGELRYKRISELEYKKQVRFFSK